MLRKILFSLLVAAALGVNLPGARVAVLPELNDPAFDIVVDKDRMYVPDGPSIFIYSLTDYKMIGKFGKKGEGPREFKGEVSLTVLPDILFISSEGKISHFSKDDEFIKEIACPEKGNRLVKPVGDGYVGFGAPVQDGADQIRYNTLCFYDRDFRPGKVFTRSKSRFQRDGSITFMDGTFNFKVYGDLIFVQYNGKEFRLDCFDSKGELKVSIRDDQFKNREVSGEDRRRALDYIKRYMPWVYEARERTRFPRWWGGVGTFYVDAVTRIIYIISYLKQGNRALFYLYDLSGQLIKKLFLPVGDRNIWAPYPLDIYGGKIYQLIENLDDECWELHITDIE